jgi:hypothetical protein
MFVRLRVQGFESSVNRVFQKEKLVSSKTMIYSPHLKGSVQQELTYFKPYLKIDFKIIVRS